MNPCQAIITGPPSWSDDVLPRQCSRSALDGRHLCGTHVKLHMAKFTAELERRDNERNPWRVSLINELSQRWVHVS